MQIRVTVTRASHHEVVNLSPIPKLPVYTVESALSSDLSISWGHVIWI